MPHAGEKIREAIEENHMKRFFGFALMLVLLAAPAFASQKPQTVTFAVAVQVGWTGSGSDVQVTLTQNKKAVVTFPAKAVEGKYNPGVETEAKGGVNILETIQLNSVSLVLGGASHSGQ
jgi:opacity protein-like surface antigen